MITHLRHARTVLAGLAIAGLVTSGLAITPAQAATHYTVSGAIGARYASVKGTLGQPSCPMQRTGHDGYRQTFQHGTIAYDHTGTHVVTGAIWKAWTASGAEKSSYGPVRGGMVTVGGVTQQRFGSTAVLSYQNGKVIPISGAIGVAYIRAGQIRSEVGYPTSTMHKVKGGDQQNFSNGNIQHRYGYTYVTTTRGQKAVTFATSKVGGRYVWGGTGARGYDCSGLTQAAWRAGGVSLPRVTTSQVKAGRAVSKADLRPGDLVFYSHNTHVALYVGHGQVVHAANARAGIKISPITSSGPISAMRRIG